MRCWALTIECLVESPSMRIPGFERKPNRYRERVFDDLSPSVRWRAESWLAKFLRRWRGNLPSWRHAILIGQARRLAINPPDSSWGRSMLAKRGGYAVQRAYQIQGRMEKRHPAHRAALISASKRKLRKQQRDDELSRKAFGLPPKTHHRYLPLF